MATVNLAYTNFSTIASVLTNVASSATFVGGAATTQINNASTLYLDMMVSGAIQVANSTVTANSQIQIFALGALTSSVAIWPDVFTGTIANLTLTSAGIGQGFLKRVAALNVDAITAGRVYPFGPVALAQLFGGELPQTLQFFVTHNTGTILASTAATSQLYFQGITATVV